MKPVTLVIPGRDCADTLGLCLDACIKIRDDVDSLLQEIIYVDDGSTDDSLEIASGRGVCVHRIGGCGAGAARNAGWRVARTPLIWFVDSDCVPALDALKWLVPHLSDESVGAVSGTYGNARADSLLARLIHEEIVERHRLMGEDVDFLATFNVLYRRDVLEKLDGFDERYLKAQDAELSFRAKSAGCALRFERRSIVDHHHEGRIFAYLRTQRRQGYWRVWLHLEHPGRASGNSYSGLLDHLQPVAALALLGSIPVAILPWFRWAPIALAAIVLLLQAPMTVRLLRRVRRPECLLFAPLSAIRAIWRGVGLAQGAFAFTAGGGRRS